MSGGERSAELVFFFFTLSRLQPASGREQRSSAIQALNCFSFPFFLSLYPLRCVRHWPRGRGEHLPLRPEAREQQL